MTTVSAKFDGKAFVPELPVDLPVGTKVTVAIPAEQQTGKARRRPTPEELEEKRRFVEELNATESYFPTVEHALGYSRKYPGYYP